MDKPPAPTLALQLFGGARLLLGGERVSTGARRGLALLAYLALLEGGLQREHAAVLLWPEADLSAGRARLRRLMYQLEEACGHDLFDTRDGLLRLRPGVLATDVQAFRRVARLLVGQGTPGMSLEAVLALTRSACAPLLEGLDFGSEAFDDWVQTMRLEHQHLLVRTLTRIAELQRLRGDAKPAADTLELLLRLDPCCESAHRLRMELAAEACDVGGVESAFDRCAAALRAEFGCRPASATEQAYADCLQRAASGRPAQAEALPSLGLRFANGPHGTIAYAITGAGPEALVVMPGFVSHIEIGWEHPGIRKVLAALGRRFTLVLFDRRGVGLSERLDATGTVAAMTQDVLTIMDAASIERAWLFGSSEGGPAAVHLAATQPQRIAGLMLFGALAKGSRTADHPWALHPQAFDLWMQHLLANWGGPADIETFAPSLAADPWSRAWWARLLRQAASPASLRHMLEGLRDADVRDDLARVSQPTLVMHRRGDKAVRFEAGQALARGIGGARFVPLDGDDHWWWAGDAAAVIDAMLAFEREQSR
ncbi:MAG TPA: alpha/beta fold hydrolase [Rhizobacter sp.]